MPNPEPHFYSPVDILERENKPGVDALALCQVELLRNNEPSGFDQWELDCHDTDTICWEIRGYCSLKRKHLSNEGRRQLHELLKKYPDKNAVFSVRVRFKLFDVAYVQDIYMKVKDDCIGVVSADPTDDGVRKHYFFVRKPSQSMKPITYIHSRLTLSRYNTWRFIWCCVHLPGPVPPLKQRTIEWLVDMFFQTYGRTHDGTPRGFPLHRADARSALARHALWLRAQLYDQKLISRVVWDHWCDVEIPALRQEAARNGFTFGHLPALPGDPEGRSHIKEVPDDPTNERLDDRQKTREDRLRAPARRRASRRTRSSSPPSDRTHVRRRITRISDDEDLPREEAEDVPMDDDDQGDDDGPNAGEDNYESDHYRPVRHWKLRLSRQMSFLGNRPCLALSRTWRCPFAECWYEVDLLHPDDNARDLILDNPLFDELDGHPTPAMTPVQRDARARRQQALKEELYERLQRDARDATQHARLLEPLAYLHWARHLWQMEELPACRYFFERAKDLIEL